MKPWAAIYRAMLDGDVPFWLPNAAPVDRIHVLPASMERFDHVAFDQSRHPDFPFDDFLHTREIGEVINRASQDLSAFVFSGDLTLVKRVKAKVARRQQVIALAQRLASSSEVARRKGISSHQVLPLMLEHGIKPELTMWPRESLAAILSL